MSDTELWQAWRERGDAEAFTTLVDRYLDMVYATARRILGNTHDAEDVAQECFISLLRGRVTVQDPLGPWLHRVTRNRALDKIKGEVRRRDRERVFHDEKAAVDEPAIDDILEHVDAAIDALPADLRDAVIGRFLEGKTNQALGEAMGVGESTIRFRVNKGVEQIREALKKQGLIVTAAALGVFLEKSMAFCAPSALSISLGKLALGTLPSTASVRPDAALRTFRPPRPVAVSLGVAVVLAAAYLGATGLGLWTPHKQVDYGAKVTTTIRPLSQEATANWVSEPDHLAAIPASATIAEESDNEPIAEITPKPEEPTSILSGTIYDERGYPVPGATITVASRDGLHSFERMQVFTATTDADGAYTVAGIRHHKIYWGYTTTSRSGKESKFSGLIRFDPPNLRGFVQVGVTAMGYMTVNEQNVQVEPGTHKEDVDFTLTQGMTMRGRVVWPDGKPVQHAGIVPLYLIKSFSGDYSSPRRTVSSSDEDGNFLLGFAEEGTVSLMVTAPNGHQVFFSEIPANKTEIPTLTMTTPMVALSGTVVTGDGRPLAQALISVQGRFGVVDDPDYAHQVESLTNSEILAAYSHSTYSDMNGVFSFEALAAVPDVVLLVDAPLLRATDGYKRLLAYHVGSLSPGKATNLKIVLPGVEQVMQIAVQVVGEQSGKPLPFTHVIARSTDNQQFLYFSPGFEDIPNYPVKQELRHSGSYRIWPEYNGLKQDNERDLYGQEFEWKAGMARSFSFRIPDPVALSVQIVDTSRTPIPDAEVEAVANTSSTPAGKTDAEGVVRFEVFVPDMPAYFRVSKEGYMTDETVAVIGEPMESYTADTVVLHRTGGVEGRLVDGNGAPLSSISVGLVFTADDYSWLRYQKETSQVSRTIMTDEDGTFALIDEFPAGAGEFQLKRWIGRKLDGATEAIALEIVAGHVLDLGDLLLEPIGEPSGEE